jgi:hypothetical protein
LILINDCLLRTIGMTGAEALKKPY